jgi:hypothetical protein
MLHKMQPRFTNDKRVNSSGFTETIFVVFVGMAEQLPALH